MFDQLETSRSMSLSVYVSLICTPYYDNRLTGCVLHCSCLESGEGTHV